MYKICKVCPKCYNENFVNCSEDTFACVECGAIYDNVNQLEDMDFQEKISIEVPARKILKLKPTKIASVKRADVLKFSDIED